LDWHIFNESEMARSSECRDRCAQKVLDAADIVREAILQQLTFNQSYNFLTVPRHREMPHDAAKEVSTFAPSAY
jgi:hypothetical protein